MEENRMKAKPVLSGAEAKQVTKLISLAHNKEGKKKGDGLQRTGGGGRTCRRMSRR